VSIGNGSCIVYTRPGFEEDAIAELKRLISASAFSGVKINAQEGFVLFEGAHKLFYAELRRNDLIFSRQVLCDCHHIALLSSKDRITPIVEFLLGLSWKFADVFFETPDTNEGKSLSSLFKKINIHFQQAAQSVGMLDADSEYRLHLFFLSGTELWVGRTRIAESSSWPMGIPRLRLPPNAPSRACMKLEEALMTLLTPDDQKRLLKSGMKVVDLGAAPGGWTWQMVRRNMWVTAVDNGAMNKDLMATGQVEHVRADGFKFRPRKKVDWFLCDIVDKPARVAQLVADWVQHQHADNYIFNLKLPMKKRVEEIEKCEEKILAAVPRGRKYKLVIKQLYHDRQEVTCFLSLASR